MTRGKTDHKVVNLIALVFVKPNKNPEPLFFDQTWTSREKKKQKINNRVQFGAEL